MIFNMLGITPIFLLIWKYSLWTACYSDWTVLNIAGEHMGTPAMHLELHLDTLCVSSTWVSLVQFSALQKCPMLLISCQAKQSSWHGWSVSGAWVSISAGNTFCCGSMPGYFKIVWVSTSSKTYLWVKCFLVHFMFNVIITLFLKK